MDCVITPALDRRLGEIHDRELEVFDAAIPRSRTWLQEARSLMPNGVPVSWMTGFWRHSPVVVESGSGSTFVDLDGNRYRDFNLCDLAMAAGFAPPAIVRATTEQAERGNHFLLPTTAAADVSRLLRDRFALPSWQYTLSASGATVDALRLARAFTGRQRVVVFDAKYHGHLDEMLWSGDDRAHGLGLPAGSGRHVTAVPFNDEDALTATLAAGDVAAVMLEPVMTNCGLVPPRPGFLALLRRLATQHGSLVVADVTHTQFAVLGGGAHDQGLAPDLVVGGKGIAGGVPIGVFGMTQVLADYLGDHPEGDYVVRPPVPTGGTLYGNALSLAAARAGLGEVFTPAAHTRVDALGARLQQGLQRLVDDSPLRATIDRWGGRCQWRLTVEAPVTGADGLVSAHQRFADTRKVFFANRGIWDAIATAGPAVSFAAGADDVDAYLEVSAQFLHALGRPSVR